MSEVRKRHRWKNAGRVDVLYVRLAQLLLRHNDFSSQPQGLLVISLLIEASFEQKIYEPVLAIL